MFSIKRLWQIVAVRSTAARGKPLPNSNLVGKTLRNRYRILAVLGEGGFGKTYLAEDLDMPGQPHRVVKQLLSEKMSAATRAYFKREACTLMNLGHEYPQIPTLYTDFEVDGIPFLVQDFVEGHNLAQEIASHQDALRVDSEVCWTEEDAIVFLTDMLGILDYIHGKGIIHRDIKPLNIMRRSADDVLVLIDFGIVKDLGGEGSSPDIAPGSLPFGSKGYTPMEQWLLRPKRNSDIYALGMTVIQALTGVHPVCLHVDDKLGHVRWSRFASVSPALVGIINRMILENAEERYQSAQEVLKDLKPLLPRHLRSYRSPSRFVRRSEPVVTTPVVEPQEKKKVVRPKPVRRKKARSWQQLVKTGLVVVPTCGLLGVTGVWGFGQLFPSGEELVKRADQAIKDGKYQKAIADASLAIRQNDANSGAYFHRALAKSKLNDYKGALDDYNKHIYLTPGHSDDYYNRGNLKEKLNDYKGALADYDKVISLNPQNSNAYNNRGILKKKLNDDKGELADYNQAISLNPQNSNAYYNRGILKKKLQDKVGAIKDFRQAAKLYRQQGNRKDLQDAIDRLRELGTTE